MNLFRRQYKKLVNKQIEDRLIPILLVSVASLLILTSYFFPINYFEELFFLRPAYLMKVGKYMYLDYYPAYPPLYFFTTYFLITVSTGSDWGIILAARFLTIVSFCIADYLMYSMIKKTYGKRLALVTLIGFLLGYSITSLSGTNLMRNLTALFSILSVYYLLTDKRVKSALCIALGTMCYLMPLLLLLPLLKNSNLRDKIKVILTTAGTLFLLNVPFLLLNPPMYLSSYLFNLNRAPYETIWALLEGYYFSGPTLKFEYTFTPLNVLQPESSKWPVMRQVEEGVYGTFYVWQHPYMKISIIVLLIVLELIGYFVFNVQKKENKLKYIAFTMTTFFLFSSVFSEGWGVFYSPFLIFAASSLQGLLITVLFYLTEAVGFLYFFSFGSNTFWRWWDWYFSWNRQRAIFVTEVVFRSFLFIYTILLLISQTKVVNLYIKRIKSSLMTNRHLICGLLFLGVVVFSATLIPFIKIVITTPDDDPYFMIRDQPFSKAHPITIELPTTTNPIRFHFDSSINATFTIFNKEGKTLLFPEGNNTRSADYGVLNATSLYVTVTASEDEEGALDILAVEGRAKTIIDSILPLIIVWMACIILISPLLYYLFNQRVHS